MGDIKVENITDPYFPNQWNLKLLNVPAAWQYSLGEGVVVGIIDSGVDGSHQDLGWEGELYISALDSVADRKVKYKAVLDSIEAGTHPKILPGWNFVESNNDTWDVYRHGTYLAGTICAESDGFGMVGVAPAAKIRPYVVIDSNGFGSQDYIAAAIKKAVDHKCDVINISLVVPYLSAVLEEAIDYASKSDTIIVSASGNDNVGNLRFPAACSNVLAVGGCNAAGDRWVHSSTLGSNYGEGLMCVAPGASQVTTFYMRSRFTSAEGTSQAAANMSGAVALLKAVDKSLRLQDVKDLIQKYSSRSKVGWDRFVGWGVPDVCEMVKAVCETPINLKEIALQLKDISEKINNISLLLQNTSTC